MTPSDIGRRRTVTDLLHDAVAAREGDAIDLDTLLEPLRTRAFGALLLVLAIPNFIPLPLGIGGIMGVLVVLLGLQMLCGLEHPLVPAWLRHRKLQRTRVDNFLKRSAPVTRRLERWCKPRLAHLTQRPWLVLSGLALVVLGALLALPIPFTNYPFGAILLAFSFALLERDGLLLLVLWGMALALLGASFFFSQTLIELMQQMVHQFF